jgi:hypothetical protein
MMKHIKLFENSKYPSDEQLDNITLRFWKNRFNLVDKLKDGFAISISKNNVEIFLKVLSDESITNYFWMDLPKYSKHYISDRYYFVLIGNRLLHSDKPYFGSQELEVYTPSFVKN